MTTAVAKQNKQQLMQAFEQIINDRKNLESKIATKEEEAAKAKNQEVLEAASAYTVDSIVTSLANLQLEFGSIVNSLSERLATENSKLDELKQAIEIENQYLQELQKIRIVADILDLLTKEHQEKLAILETDINSKREILEKEIAQAHKEWEKEQINFAETVTAYDESLRKQRQQQEEEYQYKLQNTHKIDADTYESKKRNIEREIQDTTQDKEKKWQEREKFLQDNQSLLQEYKQKSAEFPTELDTAFKKAKEEAIKETAQKAKVQADLLEKEWEANKQSYELKIKSLEETIQKQSEQIESISNQLQSTLQQAQSLAMRAFDSSAK